MDFHLSTDLFEIQLNDLVITNWTNENHSITMDLLKESMMVEEEEDKMLEQESMAYYLLALLKRFELIV